MNPSLAKVVLVHAPYGRDAAIICQVFESAGIQASICSTIEALCQTVGEETGAILISDESLTQSNVVSLAKIVSSQPPWSDLPLIVTTSGGEATAASKTRLKLMEPLGNVSLLERPLRKVTLVSAAQIALRSRRRQYQLRENFADRERLLRELERSNDELAQFSHIVSHDLQAPIRMVKTFSQLLSRRYQGKLDAQADKFINEIDRGASTMQELVESLLHYATVGQGSLVAAEVDLTDVVTTVINILAPAIEDSHATVFYDPVPNVWGDRLQVQQIIQNLIGNALKYRKADHPSIVRLFAEQTGNFLQISIRDNGPGIASEYHDLIFQPLKRLHGQNISGTGMGLAVCRKIVERHGGRIWVESTLGEGATFKFTIPSSGNS